MASMEHVYILYFFMTFALGLISIIIAINIYIKTRKTLISYFLCFYTPFTLIVIISASLIYMRANVTDIISANVLHPLRYFEAILLHILIYTIPMFANVLFSVQNVKVKNRIFGVIAIITYLSSRFLAADTNHELFRQTGLYLGSIILLSSIMYFLFTGLYHYKKLEDSRQKKLSIKILILLILFMPAIIHDLFHLFHLSIRFFPIIYCIFSIIFTHHLLNYYHHNHDSENKSPEKEIFIRYNISAREQEIISLLLQGYSNQNISSTLFITLSTVKTHLRNIYSKFGINSRFQLLTRFKNTDELLSKRKITNNK